MSSIKLFTQEMEVADSSEMLIHVYQTAWRQFLEDQIRVWFYDTEVSK
jgi:O-acetylhomoserine/O-acetylserine sulfhydrylase-like pyridoxal-dependent enzyme